MNAIEYFKSYGLSEAKRILRDARGCASVRLYDKYNFSTDDLKQIVDAFELVESLGGIAMAKDVFDIEIYEPHYNYDAEKVTRIEQAINLVEQCDA